MVVSKYTLAHTYTHTHSRCRVPLCTYKCYNFAQNWQHPLFMRCKIVGILRVNMNKTRNSHTKWILWWTIEMNQHEILILLYLSNVFVNAARLAPCGPPRSFIVVKKFTFCLLNAVKTSVSECSTRQRRQFQKNGFEWVICKQWPSRFVAHGGEQLRPLGPYSRSHLNLYKIHSIQIFTYLMSELCCDIYAKVWKFVCSHWHTHTHRQSDTYIMFGFYLNTST